MSEDDGGGQTAGAGVGRVAKTRVRLTRPEKLEIMKLCVEHGHEYSLPGGRGAFWEKISRLGTARTGRDVRNPSQMVRKLLDMYVAGTPGSSWRTGELAACLEAWKNRVDQVRAGISLSFLGFFYYSFSFPPPPPLPPFWEGTR